jgi:hypothetical protein
MVSSVYKSSSGKKFDRKRSSLSRIVEYQQGQSNADFLFLPQISVTMLLSEHTDKRVLINILSMCLYSPLCQNLRWPDIILLPQNLKIYIGAGQNHGNTIDTVHISLLIWCWTTFCHQCICNASWN